MEERNEFCKKLAEVLNMDPNTIFKIDNRVYITGDPETHIDIEIVSGTTPSVGIVHMMWEEPSRLQTNALAHYVCGSKKAFGFRRYYEEYAGEITIDFVSILDDIPGILGATKQWW